MVLSDSMKFDRLLIYFTKGIAPFTATKGSIISLILKW
nr:MAG TPA: hypothetical protein [Caudoviricetes sp.]